MKHPLFLAIPASVLIAFSATDCAQHTATSSSGSTTDSASMPASRTKIERFGSRPGVVIVKGYSAVGSVKGEYGDEVIEVEAVDLRDPRDSTQTRGLVLDVTGATTDEQHRSFIDYDEIQSLLQGLDYIARVDSSVTRLKNFEVSYRTQGDVVITTFNGVRNRTMVSVKSGDIGGVQVFVDIRRIQALRDLIAEARTMLDSLAPRRGA